MDEKTLRRFYSKTRLLGMNSMATTSDTAAQMNELGLYETDRCLIWTGRIRGRAPMFDFQGINSSARKVIWEHFNGPIEPFDTGEVPWVLNTCTEPHCVNPRHLYLGTRHEHLSACIKEQKDRWKQLDEQAARQDMKRRKM